jgi:hypothetical protein
LKQPKEIKIYCVKITATNNLQKMYKDMMKNYYDFLNGNKDKSVEIEFYTKSFIEPPMGGKFIIQKSPNSKDYYEKWKNE